MAGNSFQYVINAKLQLQPGSLKQILQDIKTVDASIKAQFEKSGGGIKVPISVDPNTKGLQEQMSRVIKGYNNGQVPTIKVPVAIDEDSIKRLQGRISEIKRQLNVADDKDTLKVNTSIVVGKDEESNVQKQLDFLKPTIEVRLTPNEEDMKSIKNQVESIKAEIQANIVGRQPESSSSRLMLGRVDRGVGTISRSAINRGNRTDRFLIQRQQISGDIKSMQETRRLLEQEFRGIDDLSKLQSNVNDKIAQIDKAKSGKKSYTRVSDINGNYEKQINSKDFDSALQGYKQTLKNLDQLSQLQKQINEKQKSISELERTFSYGGKSVSSFPANHPYYETAQRIREKSDADYKAKIQQQKQTGKTTNVVAPKTITQDDIVDRYVGLNSQRSAKQLNLSNLERVANSRSSFSRISPQAQSQMVNFMGNLRKEIEELNTMIDNERAKLQAETLRTNYSTKDGRKLEDALFKSVGGSTSDHDAKVKSWQDNQNKQAQQELEKLWTAQGAYSQLPANGKVSKLISKNNTNAQKQAQREQYMQGLTSDFQSGTARFGPNRQYSGTDLERLLLNPNVSLKDSLGIIHNQLNPMNASMARQNGENFQKAYGIKYTDNDGNIRSVRTLTYEYTKLGEVIERGNKGFSGMMDHAMQKVGIFSVLEGALMGVSDAILRSVESMAQFDQQLAEVQSTTQNMQSSTGQLKDYYSNVGGVSSMQSDIMNNTFQNAETYGVSALDTVMPIQQQVLARQGLTAGSDGKYSTASQNGIANKIMEFSAVSTGGHATPEETNALTHDALSLYQAYYQNGQDPISKMNSTFDFMANMKTNGVNTNAIADAMSELAPDTLQSGVNGNQVMSMLGAFNLVDTDASGSDMQTVGRTFFNSIRHADTNDNLKSSLRNMMGIDLDKTPMDSQKLLNSIISGYGNLNDANKELFAGSFAGVGGKANAMTPKMVKLLDGTQSQYYQNFMGSSATSSGALDKSWLPFSETLKTNFAKLVESLTQFSMLLGRLGVIDSFGVMIKGVTGLVQVINRLLMGMQSLSDFFSNMGLFNVPKFVMEMMALTGVLKGLQLIVNSKKFAPALGDFFSANLGTRLGVKEASVVPNAVSLSSEQLLANSMSGNLPITSAFSAGVPIIGTPRTNGVVGAVENTEERTAGNLIKFENHTKMPVSGMDMNAMLENVMTFTTADMLANDFKNNPAVSRMLNKVNSNVIPKSTSEMNVLQDYSTARDVRWGSQGLGLTSAIEKTATKPSALSSVGSWLSDAFFISTLRGSGPKSVSGANVADKTAEVVTKLGTSFSRLLPVLSDTLLFFTRFSLIGGIILGVSSLVVQAKNNIQQQIDKMKQDENKNVPIFYKKTSSDPVYRSNMTKSINDWVATNQQFQKNGGLTPQSMGGGDNLINSTDLAKSQKMAKTNDNMQRKYGLTYTTDKNGKGVLGYKALDSNGQLQDYSANVDNKKEMAQFQSVLQNGGLDQTAELADKWKINTGAVVKYQQELATVSEITSQISAKMSDVNTNTKKVDAKYDGVNSYSALQEKINISKDGISGSQAQVQQATSLMSGLKSNLTTVNNSYNKGIKRALNNGVSQSQIDSAVMALQEQLTSGGDQNIVLNQYKQLTSKDAKDQGLSKSQMSDANKFNAIMTGILNAYIYKTKSQDEVNQGASALNQATDSLNSQIQSQKDLATQAYQAKLALDSMNASLSSLSTIANAGKALVNVTANPLNNGNNDNQIGALSSSMQISNMQLSNLQEQRARVQQEMSSLTNDNPNQDFSLNTLYSPKGDVTAEQQAYKNLYETYNQLTDSITNQNSSMFDQITQLRDLVLTSSKYADTWQRIQDNVQLVKDSIKQTGDFNSQIANINSNSLSSSINGTDPWTAKKQQLQSMSSSDMNMANQLQNALTSSKGDSTKLAQAMADIQKNEGDQFEQNVVNPLKDIVNGSNNSFMSAGNIFSTGANNFSTAVGSFTNAVNSAKQAQSQPSSSSSTPDYSSTSPSGSPATIGGYSQTAGSEASYLASLGYTPGSADYINAKRQFDAMTPTDQQSAIDSSSNSGPVVDAINKVFSGTQLDGYGSVYANFGSQYGVDPRLMASITMAETGGHSSALSNQNNVGGIMGGAGGGLQTFTSIDSSVQYLAQLLGKYYLGEGLNTIPAIQSKYAPYNATNDPQHLNDNWRNNVSSFYSEMTGISKDTLLGGSQTVQSTPTSAPSASNSNGGVNSMFGWYNSILNDTSKMQYVWGGAHGNNEDWNTFIQKAEADCSGLVNQVYKNFMGINLGNPATTTSESMWNSSQGSKVDRSNLQSGDLVFFGSGGDASHVGVYAGNNQMYTIDHSGMPVTKENLWSDYIGGKHYNSPNGPVSSSITQSVVQNQADLFVQAITKFINAMSEATQALNPQDTVDSLNHQLKLNMAVAYGNGNIQDVLGTSGRINSFDVIQQARQGIYSQQVQNKDQIDYQNAQRNQVIAEMQTATNNGDASSYNEYHAQLASIDQYITALMKNTDALQSLDSVYKAQQQQDPKYNYDTASSYIQGGMATLKIQNSAGQDYSVDYNRVVNEVNSMLSNYDTPIKNTQALQSLWNQTGEQTPELSYTKSISDQNNINLVYTQLYNIGQVLNKFAQGTQLWYSSLETVVETEKALQQLEQTRLDNAKTNFELTGTGSSAYIQQQAYMNSVGMNNASKGYQDAMSNYKSGVAGQAGYGIQTSYFSPTAWGSNSAKTIVDYMQNNLGVSAQQYYRPDGNIGIRTTSNDMTMQQAQSTSDVLHSKFGMLTSAYPQSGHMGFQTNYFGNNTFGYVSAHTIADDVKNKFGVNTEVTNPDGKHIGVQAVDQNLSADTVKQINDYIQKKFKVISSATGSSSNKSDLNTQLAGLQVIADAHNKMIDQMNTYKQAVTDGFRAGAMSIDEYISKLNTLRDKQTEAKDNAISMVSSIQSGFKSALSDALTQGMQGSINSPIDFMNNIKSTISSSVSSQLTDTLLQNTGLQDTMNGITKKITEASTSGDPNAIVNMFNSNDFGKQIQDAIAPFLPMIQQIVGSTKGIFTILKNQTFNATSGFKIDNYMNEIASKQTYQGLKTWNSSMTNDVGSPIVNAGSGGTITTTAPSQIPTGVPTTVSTPVNGTTTQTGPVVNTIGGGIGAPSTTTYTNGSNNNTPFPSAPKVAPVSSTPATSTARTYVVKSGDNPWTIENKLGLPHGWITQHNAINPNALQIGQVLKYHTGGIAGMMNFQSADGLKSNEVSAILQKAETVFQPRQIDDLVSGSYNAGKESSNNGDTNINITVNVEGGSASDKQGIEQTVKLAVSQALSEFKKQQRLGNLSWKGTSY